MSMKLDEKFFRTFFKAATKEDPSYADGFTEDQAVEQAKKTVQEMNDEMEKVLEALSDL